MQALKSGQIGSMALDVYEEETDLFFEDHSDDIIQVRADLLPQRQNTAHCVGAVLIIVGARARSPQRHNLMFTIKSVALQRCIVTAISDLFNTMQARALQDDVFARLMSFPNVLMTAHQGFLTHEALTAIADVTLANVAAVLGGDECENRVMPE